MKNQIKPYAFAFFLLFLGAQLSAGNLVVRGQVKGLASDERKTKPIVLEKTKIKVFLDDKRVLEKNTLKGAYTFKLTKSARYRIEVTCKDYHKKMLWLNTNDLPALGKNEVLELTDLDFLLLNEIEFPEDISEEVEMGEMRYNPQKKTFQIDVNRAYRSGNHRLDNSLRLLRKTITYIRDARKKKINYGLLKSSFSPEVAELFLDSAQLDSVEKRVKIIHAIDSSLQVSFSEFETLDDIRLGYDQLDSAKSKLRILMESAVTAEDSLVLSKMEIQIELAELNLKMAEKTIINQNKEIESQKKINTLYGIGLLVLLLVLGVIFWMYRDRTKINSQLRQTNKLIRDGIVYAETIQRSYLKTPEEIKKIIPEFALFFRPKDVVSGDIYWVNELDQKVFVAAIDCTGHGVPGALISMAANSLLNEIVNTKKISDPGKILNELHNSVVKTLQQEVGHQQAQDGMDMSLLVLDRKTKSIQFAGAKNHLYVINNGEMEIVRADFQSIGGRALRAKDGFTKNFKTQDLEIDSGATVYLFSDGFVDQFGGESGEKYNLPRFYELLMECSKLKGKEQERLLHERFEKWKGEQEQLDDVLVIGVQF